jgi:hypothetical protein
VGPLFIVVAVVQAEVGQEVAAVKGDGRFQVVAASPVRATQQPLAVVAVISRAR